MAVAGRWGFPELRSSLFSASPRLGARSIRRGANAAAVSRKKMPSPIARPAGGNQSQTPSHDTARNRPITVASDAIAGHSRSQKIVQRARSRARASTSLPASGCVALRSGIAASGGWSFNEISSSQESAPAFDINTRVDRRHWAKGRHQPIKTSIAGIRFRQCSQAFRRCFGARPRECKALEPRG